MRGSVAKQIRRVVNKAGCISPAGYRKIKRVYTSEGKHEAAKFTIKLVKVFEEAQSKKKTK